MLIDRTVLLFMANELYTSHDKEMIIQQMTHKPEFAVPEFHRFLLSLEKMPDFEPGHLQYVTDIVLTVITRQTLLNFIAMDENQKREVAMDWAPYLVHGSAFSVWKKIELEDNLKHLREKVPRAESIIVQAAIRRLFGQNTLEGAEAWSLHAKDYLLKSIALSVAAFETSKWSDGTAHDGIGFVALGKLHYIKRLTPQQPLGLAFSCFATALNLLTKEFNPRVWAEAKVGHALCLWQGISADTNKIEQIIENFEDALTVWSESYYPEQWGNAHFQLSNAYSVRKNGIATENIKKSLDHATKAESVLHLPKITYPAFQLYLSKGTAHFYFSEKGDKAHLDAAIAYLEKASSFIDITMEDLFSLVNFKLGTLYLIKSLDFDVPAEQGNYYEKTIKRFENALRIFTMEEDGEQWAITKWKLGLALQNFTTSVETGDHRLKYAIQCHEDSLIYYNKSDYPDRWSDIKICIGDAYYELSSTNRLLYTDHAIANLEEGLSVTTIRDDRVRYSTKLKSLGDLYRQRKTGRLNDNTEKAINLYTEAINQLSIEAEPVQWAWTKINLGVSYQQRFQFDQAENMEKCIQCYDDALLIFSREEYPDEWAMIMNNLGADYKNRIYGDREDNLQKSILYSNSALEIRTKKDYPYKWAAIHHNLGNLYFLKEKGNRLDNLQLARGHFKKALEIRTRDKYPSDWVNSMLGLSNCYRALCFEGNADSIRQALQNGHAIENAGLWMSESEKFMLNSFLGSCYEVNAGNKEENQLKAIRYLALAIDGTTGNSIIPSSFTATCVKLGHVYYQRKEYEKAIEVLEKGRIRGENHRLQQAFNISKEITTENLVDTYSLLVACCLKLSRFEQAYNHVIAAKGRTLTDKLVTEKNSYITKAKDPAIQNLRAEIEDIHLRLENAEMHLLNPLIGVADIGGNRYFSLAGHWHLQQEIESLRKSLQERKKELSKRIPEPETSITFAPVTTTQLQQMALATDTYLVDLFHSYAGTNVFIVSKNDLHVVMLSDKCGNANHNVMKWIYEIEMHLATGNGLIRQKRVFQELFAEFIDPILPFLKPGARLLIALHRRMHYIPIHLAMNRRGQFLYEMFETTFISNMNSAYALWAKRKEGRNLKNKHRNNKAFIVSHAGTESSKLINIVPEINFVQSCYPDNIILSDTMAKPSEVIRISCEDKFDLMHFCCHGKFRYDEPPRSSLELDGFLSVETIHNDMLLQDEPIVILSACETSRSALKEGDELNGFNQAFLQSGAGFVVSSLWQIGDEATKNYFKIFYEELFKEKINGSAVSLPEILKRTMNEMRKNDKELSVFYWGAFQLYGLP